MRCIELRGDARLEDEFVHGSWNAVAIVDAAQLSVGAFMRYSKVDTRRVGIARVAQEFKHYILAACDVLRCLSAFRFGRAQSNEAIPEIGFDSEMASALDRFDELLERTG